MTAFQPVRAVVRALEVLSLVSEAGEITASAIARRLGLPQPTVVRLLETLESCGYVYRRSDGRGYSVSARTKTLSRGYDARSRLIQIARPQIDILHAEVGWPSNLAVREGRSMVIAYSNRAAYGMSMPGRLGAQIPFLATGVGMVYLAHMPEAARAALLSGLGTSGARWDRDPALWADLDARLAKHGRDPKELMRTAFVFSDLSGDTAKEEDLLRTFQKNRGGTEEEVRKRIVIGNPDNMIEVLKGYEKAGIEMVILNLRPPFSAEEVARFAREVLVAFG